ncbi:hypothetical protein NST81_09355 [Bacillus sp. FSL W8-0223]|uniref:hypothetical protein n=1 Tax=Bacillus sp. FSL W8-0223 TaxID=2954595 RepID=UPI0030F6AEEC
MEENFFVGVNIDKSSKQNKFYYESNEKYSKELVLFTLLNTAKEMGITNKDVLEFINKNKDEKFNMGTTTKDGEWIDLKSLNLNWDTEEAPNILRYVSSN